MKRLLCPLLILSAVWTGCSDMSPVIHAPAVTSVPSAIVTSTPAPVPAVTVQKSGMTVGTRFSLPKGFERVDAAEGSFAAYLRNRPLKPDGSPVLLFDGREKPVSHQAAVLDIDVGNRDLQQCADAVMRLRADWLYSTRQFQKIRFHFVSGFLCDWPNWAQGNRVVISGNNVTWVKKTGYKDDYETFRGYLDMVYAYAGTESLVNELTPVKASDMKPGDVWIRGPLPGHAVIVTDMAVNRSTGEKLFQVAQSYMPAQSIHILKNENQPALGPWYPLPFEGKLRTPEWTFEPDQLRRFQD